MLWVHYGNSFITKMLAWATGSYKCLDPHVYIGMSPWGVQLCSVSLCWMSFGLIIQNVILMLSVFKLSVLSTSAVWWRHFFHQALAPLFQATPFRGMRNSRITTNFWLRCGETFPGSVSDFENLIQDRNFSIRQISATSVWILQTLSENFRQFFSVSSTKKISS